MSFRNILNSLLPPGPIWEPKEGEGLDLFLDALGISFDTIKEDIQKIESIRDPFKTILLDDLEKEYGVPDKPVLSEADRRQRLFNLKTDNDNDGTDVTLQERLDNAGFNLTVYRNCPCINPQSILDGNFITCGEADAICGSTDGSGDYIVYCGASGGEIVVNGDIYKQFPAFTLVCGDPDVVCGAVDGSGNYLISSGEFLGNNQYPIDYTIPPISGYWPLVFFVGNGATLNPDGSIAFITPAQVDIKRRDELKRLIVKYKPMYTWCVLLATYV